VESRRDGNLILNSLLVLRSTAAKKDFVGNEMQV
jgi:hypothetical protein